MRYEEAYDNVDKGLLEAPEEVSAAYRNRTFRYILEALLLDPETPEEVYMDLLGWTMAQVDDYRNYFFCVPDYMPRLHLYAFISDAPALTEGDILRKDLLLGVYEYGWAYIDSLYNRGSRVSIQGRAIHSLKKMFGHVDRMVVDCLSNPSVAKIQPLIKLMKEAIQVEAEAKQTGAKPEQLTFEFVEKLQKSVTDNAPSQEEIMGLDFDELRKLKPIPKDTQVEQTSLGQILEDVKDNAED